MNLIASDAKFSNPTTTAEGKPRATVAITALRTLWLNTGTLCNLTCENCYIESSPSNDRLAYLTRADVQGYLREIRDLALPVDEIGITGGEPFMNPDILAIIEDCLDAGLRVLVLTNAMKPMMKCADGLLTLQARFPEALMLRVSVDHHEQALHEEERGKRSWQPMIKGLKWLSDNGFALHAAGRTRWGADEVALRAGFARLFADHDIRINAHDPAALVLFPEMDGSAEVPEISTQCWDILGVKAQDMMCASSRMVLRRSGAKAPDVVACTLLPYAEGFAFGPRLADSLGPVALNHPHCARFCVLGGGSCSG